MLQTYNIVLLIIQCTDILTCTTITFSHVCITYSLERTMPRSNTNYVLKLVENWMSKWRNKKIIFFNFYIFIHDTTFDIVEWIWASSFN